MSFLDKIKTKPDKKGCAMLFFGAPFTGKTSLVTEFPKCVIARDNLEDGINELKTTGQVREDFPVLPTYSKWEDWMDELDTIAGLSEKEFPFKYLAMDSIGGFERLCQSYICKMMYKNDWSTGKGGFGSYGAGYASSATEWDRMLEKLDVLRTKGIGILMIAHSDIKVFNDPQRESYDTIIVDMHKKTYAATEKWLGFIGYLEFCTAVDAETGKATGGRYRQMIAHNKAVIKGKNRFGIDSPISMGDTKKEAFANLTAAMVAAMKVNKAVNKPTKKQGETK